MRRRWIAAALLVTGAAMAQDSKFPDFAVVDVEVRPGPFQGRKLLVLVSNKSATPHDIWVECAVFGEKGEIFDVVPIRIPNVGAGGQALQSKIVFDPVTQTDCRVTDID